MEQETEIYEFNRIVLGFTLFAIGGMARTLMANAYWPMIVFGVAGWYFIIKGFWYLRGTLEDNEFSRGYRYLFLFYLLVCAVMIIRGYTINYRYQWITTAGMLNFHVLNQYYILPYLMPLVCFIPWQNYRLDKFCKYASWIGVVSILTFIIFFPSIVQSSIKAMSGAVFDKTDSGIDFRFYTPFAFASLLAAYITPKEWRMNILGLIAMALINMIAARRGSSLMSAVTFVASLYFWSQYKKYELGWTPKILVAIILIAATYFVLNSSLFEYLFQRGMEDSRSGVDEALLRQMTDWELIFGKGLNGRYYYPLLEKDYLMGWRYGSETGFYNIVLKGGYLMAFTYILLLAIPAYKGMFKSQNLLCKAGGFYILLSLVDLYPFGWLEFSIKFLIIWMMVPLCMSQKVRDMDDDEIREYFFA